MNCQLAAKGFFNQETDFFTDLKMMMSFFSNTINYFIPTRVAFLANFSRANRPFTLNLVMHKTATPLYHLGLFINYVNIPPLNIFNKYQVP